jgi:hypothetical protein
MRAEQRTAEARQRWLEVESARLAVVESDLESVTEDLVALEERVRRLGGDRFARPGSGHATECVAIAAELRHLQDRLDALVRGE